MRSILLLLLLKTLPILNTVSRTGLSCNTYFVARTSSAAVKLVFLVVNVLPGKPLTAFG
jgi:hypothetical protein